MMTGKNHSSGAVKVANDLKVLGASEPGVQVVPIRTAAVWDATLPTEYGFSGYRVLPLTVGR